jgi:hypothetical protein
MDIFRAHPVTWNRVVSEKILGNLLVFKHSQMKLKPVFPFLLVSLIWVACRPISYLTVELSDPPKEELPADIQSLTLVNRAVDQRFTDVQTDTLQLQFLKSQFQVDTVIYDISAADTLMDALGVLLFESGRYDVVIPEDRFLMKDTLNYFSSVMDWEQVESLTRAFNTDAVLSLDHFKTGVNTDFVRESRWNDIEGVFDPAHYAAGMSVTYVAQFRVYDPQNRNSLFSYFLTDTLIWQDWDYDLKNLFKRFTPVKTGMTEAAVVSALTLADRIATNWNSYKRAYFSSGNQILQETNPLVLENDWAAAREKWTEAVGQTRSKSLKSKLEFNIAVSYEMEGLLDEALRWGLRSYETMFRQVTFEYLNILKKRKSIISGKDEKA